MAQAGSRRCSCWCLRRWSRPAGSTSGYGAAKRCKAARVRGAEFAFSRAPGWPRQAMKDRHVALLRHQDVLARCRRCPRMQSTPVIGNPVVSKVLLVGQAPGPREPDIGRPFAWTAGKMLFKWFGEIGLDEAEFRGRVYMAAVCRCFPGKRPGGGDRVPDPDEVANCSSWLDAELALMKPALVIPVGKLAIQRFMPI